MTSSTGFMEPTPEQLEAQVANTRASLDSKLHELERRLSPREQVQRLRSRVEPERYLGATAATAVAVGAALAYRGLRRR